MEGVVKVGKFVCGACFWKYFVGMGDFSRELFQVSGMFTKCSLVVFCWLLYISTLFAR